MSMSTRAHMMPVYAPPPEAFVRGEGVRLYTEDGRSWLDFIGGIAVNALGHCHPALVAALQEQAGKLWHTSNMFRVPAAEELADKYCAHTFADRVFFTNSGTEAMEGALKAARRYHWARGNPERVDVIGFSGAFHGRTYAAVNAAGNPKYLEGFGPALPGYVNLPFGDHDALKAAIGPTTAAVLVEPVQGEGGVRALPVECLTGLRRLCDAHGILLIYDEVQCGMGRSGKLFAHDWAPDARPDIMAAAKGVGGGFPFGAFMTTEAVGQYMVVGTHGTTYGGNPLAMAVGNTVFDIISDEAFLEGVRQVSGTLTQGLKSLADSHADLIEPEERGKGLLRGLRFKANPKAVQTHAREHGLLVGVAGENVLRLAPPLIITEADVREAVGILDRAITAARPELVN